MEIFTDERPLALLTACAPLTAVRVVPTVAGAPRVQHVKVQAELILTIAPSGIEGTSGYTGKGVQFAGKRMDLRGVPPRGRPV